MQVIKRYCDVCQEEVNSPSTIKIGWINGKGYSFDICDSCKDDLEDYKPLLESKSLETDDFTEGIMYKVLHWLKTGKIKFMEKRPWRD
jgi:hypothetical protein